MVKLPIKKVSFPPEFQVKTMFTRSAYFGCYDDGVLGTSMPLVSDILNLLSPKMLLFSDSEFEKSLNLYNN